MEIAKRAKEFEDKLKKRFPQCIKLSADLSYVAYILAYTESEMKRDAEFIQKRKESSPWKDWKKVQKIVKLYPKDFQKRLLLNFAGEAFKKRMEKKREEKQFLERIRKQKLSKKPPEWYLDRAILDLGSYFEAISPPESRRPVEERRQYKLIADLFYAFDLFKQGFKNTLDEAVEEEWTRKRVIKRAEAIPAKTWNEHIQGVKESLKKSPSNFL